MGMAAFLNLVLFLYRLLPVENISVKQSKILLYIAILITPLLITTLFVLPLIFGFPLEIKMDSASIYLAASDANLLFTIFEEVIYRGILWMLLTSINISGYRLVMIQAVLFWLSHVNYLFQPIAFWFYMPFLGIVLGMMVWRTKTITASITGHFMYNWLAALLRASF